MSTEEEFLRWLHRSEKPFAENFKFALKAWNSAEFTLSDKYELVLSWLSSEAAKLPIELIPYEEFTELLQMSAQPGLIDQGIKRKFVEMFLDFTEKWAEENKQEKTCAWSRLMYRLCDFEILQDLYRTDYELHARVCSSLLISYELYLKQFDVSKTHMVSKSTKLLNNAKETEFFASVVGHFKDHVKRTTDLKRADSYYTLLVLQPLVRVILLLRTHTLCFFDELLHFERLLTDHHTDEKLVERIMLLPLHARLLTLECAIVNRRGVESFLQHLLQHVFKELSPEDEQQHNPKTPLMLTGIAHTLEIFRKHDINLNFKMELENQPPTMTYLGQQLLAWIQRYKQYHLREVLMLLCAALRLNPLILEQDIFQITTWMIVAEKKNNEEIALFGEFLVSLMDMFRRLSRAEKLVFNMLKGLKEWLSKYDLISTSKPRKSLKRKAEEDVENKSNNFGANVDEEMIYLYIIFKEFHHVPAHSNNTMDSAFPYLRAAWPTESVGVAFSKLITGLVSKPALVIWKSLLYSLKELLEKLHNQPDIAGQEKSQFLLDFHSALLCQYFSGCRLVEQYDKFSKEVNEQMQITAEMLAQFGRFLLSQEHNNRAVSAFLECVFHASNFELLLNYYRPDGLESEQLARLENFHAFLKTEEWALLQNRILNFGKAQNKFLFNRLMLQRAQAQSLFQSTSELHVIDLQKTLQSAIDDKLSSQVGVLLQKVPSTKWFVSHIDVKEKSNLLQHLLGEPRALDAILEDLGSLDLLAIALFARLSQNIAAAAKGSMLAALRCNVDTLSAYIRADQNTADKELLKLVAIIESHAQSAYKVKKLPDDEEIQKIILLCRQLPLGHLRTQSKNLIFTLYLAFYSDLQHTNAAEAGNYTAQVFEIIIDFLHFGQHVPIFKYFSLTTILQILPVASCWQFYEFVFSTIKSEAKGSEPFLTALAENLESAQTSDGKLSEDQRRLLLIAIETLAALGGPSAKRMRKHFERALAIYSKFITAYFDRHPAKAIEAPVDSHAKKDKKFVEKTLAGFAPFANALLTNTAGGTGKDEDTSAVTVDENFRRICKIYIGHSMDYRNPHAIRLMQVALNHRQLLHLDQDEIEFVLSHYWQQLNADLKTSSLIEASNVKTTETTVKMIIGNKTNEDLLLTLQSLANNLDDMKDFRNILRCLELIAKCSFSTIKGAIFNAKFKSIASNIILRLVKDEQQQFVDKVQILAILAAQQSLIENKMIPISMDTLDDILSFLMDINIKRFPLSEDNLDTFKKLHWSMTDLAGSLIRQRHILLLDRVPQFMHIFKDLMQSIVWYKSDRQKDSALSATELDDLADLAMKLEALMHLVAAHSVHFKRVAPFVLTFVIGLMVANKRATTLYPKIKTHIDNVCYDLIGICDHRVGRFILRCSNEAARQVYELYVKDHKKYHKFKGKV
ncbi:uncharacterized protein LOC128858755 [Anastrepha ludens]|uniref:uncharacterized protein LOC128858755 n=1 Tax=Anastrepha ludens TaxID=28586 RepID=UPI0023B11843|nr:uncharacterized protein LOC128858755 [Anastrepha ludens]XP_053951224.1 uncharacterized protein LOC128858755 [Anastrepha ludens]